MRISRLAGLPAATDALDKADSINITVKVGTFANDTTTLDRNNIGKVFMIDTADTTGKSVIICTSTDDHLAAGLFQGDGKPTGALNTDSATVGPDGQKKRAAIGDIIDLLVFGRGLAMAQSSATETTTIALGDTLGVIGTSGHLKDTANVGAGLISPFVSLQAYTVTDNTTTLIPVMVRCM